MNKHSSINRLYRLVWNEILGSWVPVAETTRGRKKRSGRSAAVLAQVVAALGLGVSTHAVAGGVPTAVAPAPVPPSPTTLPTGGKVVAGSGTITSSSSPSSAVLNVDQSTQRAVINWNTFNLGSAAQVNFNQPGADAATLNRVLDANPSQIFGKITAPGQVFLTNPNGVYFGKTASVDVGSLAATTNSIGDADFMAGNITLTRNGATGSVVNEGELNAGIGGYIALLAPEVRNSGVIIARMGTVAMAAGESITLNFDGNHLAGISAQPSAIAALVENKSAVLAPGGIIILSAKAVDSLQGGVIKNSGTLEATGLATKGGRIVLEASTSVENTGTISANAGADGSPAGSVAISAPEITNSGVISASGEASSAQAASVAPVAGGSVTLAANTIVQSATGTLDVSGVTGGVVALQATQDITIAGNVTVAATDSSTAAAEPVALAAVAAAGQGGNITLTAGHNVTLQSAILDASGSTQGGQIIVQGGGPVPSDPAGDPPTVALLGTTELRSSSRRGQGGTVSLTADRVGLFDAASIDASGVTGGGNVFVGGGFHGQNPSIANAQQVVMGNGATIDASATQTGSGGNVAVWSDGQTTFAGSIAARGGATSGAGGFVEVSGKGNLDFLAAGSVDAGAAHGAAGTLLLDPQDIIVGSTVGDSVASETFATNAAGTSNIAASTITDISDAGTAVTLQANNDITINNSIVTETGGATTGGALTFRAGGSITVNASVVSDNGNISFTANDSGATSADRLAGTATFLNNSVIDAGSGDVSITMGTFAGTSGTIGTGHVAAKNLTVTQNGPTLGAAAGAIDLGQSDIIGNLTITANSDRNVTNTLGNTGNAGNVVVRGTTTIGVHAGDVTITGPHTDFNVIAVTAHNLTLNDTNAVQFGTTTLSGNLSETAIGPIATTNGSGGTAPVQVAGTTSLTANNGPFGIADPYINLTDAADHFGGAVTLNVPSTGATGTGGYATIRDSGAINVASSHTTTYLTIAAGGAVTTGTINAGGVVSVTTSNATPALGSVSTTSTTASSLTISATGAVDLGTTTLGSNLSVATAGAITDSGTITAPAQTTLAAGSANDITLDSALNDFSSVIVSSSHNLTLVDKNAINFGNYAGTNGGTSSVTGNLAVTAGGDIKQTGYNGNNYAAITVGGTSTFTANGAAPINLYLGTSNPFNPGSGSANDLAGTVTLAIAPGNTQTGFSTVELRNVNASASVLSGLTSVGTLTGVYLTYDNAPSVSLPGMTVLGNLSVYAPKVVSTATVPGNVISQTGAISVSGSTILQTSSTGDIVLDNAANLFNQFGAISSRNTTVVDSGAIVLYAGGSYDQSISGNLNVTTGGTITDVGRTLSVSGTATLTAGSVAGTKYDITLTRPNNWSVVVIPAAKNVFIQPNTSLIFGNATLSGTLTVNTYNSGSTLTQQVGTAIDMTTPGLTTTFNSFLSGITLAESANVLGPLAIANSGNINIRENDAITQASAWANYNGNNGIGYNVTLATSNDQAITLDKGNYFGPLVITQINSGSVSPGAVLVRENSDNTSGMTEGTTPWTVHGTTTLDSGAYSINLNNGSNVFGPLQVIGATGSTGTITPLPSTVTLYGRSTTGGDAITDVGSTGFWATGAGVVKLVAYGSDGTTAGGGNVNLMNPLNVLGDLYVKATNATITEKDNITDGPSTSWDTAGDSGWVTTGTTDLIVANPTGKSIILDNLSNQLGPLGITTTGTVGTLTSVLITDNTNLTQAAVWNVGAAPVTLDARAHAIDLSSFSNVLGDITINTINGMPTSVKITEDDPITQGSAWIMSGVPVTLVAQNGKAITLTDPTNILGALTVTGGATSITENDDITQGGGWATSGNTTLSLIGSGHAIILTNTGNVLGPLALSGAATTVGITESDDITQAAAWSMPTSVFTLKALAGHSVVLDQAANQLGDLTLAGVNATVTENDTNGITDASAWAVTGTTTLTAGSTNPIVLNANPASNFGTVDIVSASTAAIADIDGIIFSGATIASGGTLVVTAGGPITQTGAITAPNLQLIGTGSASLTNLANNVQELAAGFSGGDLVFTNSGNLDIGVVGGTTGVNISGHNVTLTSVSGTVTGLSSVNASSSSLTISTGTALIVPQMSIAGAQTYTAGGGGVTLDASVTSSAPGAITFNSPVTLAANVTVQASNSAIKFAGTVTGGTNKLKVDAGSGTAEFDGAVSALGKTTDASQALDLSSGGATFYSTIDANNGLAVAGPVVFSDTVTLADGAAASVFTGLVTLGKVGGMDLSGYNNMSFTGGVLLQNGPTTINSNNSTLTFSGANTVKVSGPFGLTLDSGTAALNGLDHMGSDLTSLTVTAFNPSIPTGGISIAGPQTYTATSGSSITLGANVTSTAAGAITFNSPVSLSGDSTVTSVNSHVSFDATVDGNHDLTVNSGSGATDFTGIVGGIAPLGDGAGAALILLGSGTTTFSNNVIGRSGITAVGPVIFDGNVTLTNGDTASTFGGLVTSGGTAGNTISGFDGIAFNGGLALTGGPVSVLSNGSTLSFGGPVSGPEALTLNALGGTTGTVTGLDHIGLSSDLTSLTVTGQTLSLPDSGLAVAGPMTFTAAGGITLNGAVGSGATTGEIDFNSPVTLDTGAVTISSHNAPVKFVGTVDGPEALTVNAGTGVTTFGAAVGGTAALSSITTDAGGSTAINGGSIHTTGAQTYNDAVALGADSVLTGVNVAFDGPLDGAHALTVNDSGTTTFGGVVGGTTPLTSITTDAPGSVAVNTTAVTTSGAQTYNELVNLGADAVFHGVGIAFAGGIDGAHILTASAGSGALQLTGAVGASTPLTSLIASGATVAAGNVTTTGTQSYTANGGVTLSGNLATTGSAVTITGPTTLGGDVTIGTTGGDITFSGPTSTINGAHGLTLTAGTGNVVLGGVVGGIVPLTSLTISGNDLTLSSVNTVGGQNQSYTALDNITVNQNLSANSAISFVADSDDSGVGSFILLDGLSITATNNDISITAADLDLRGSSTLSAGSGTITITATHDRNIALGGSDAPGQLTISNAELSHMTSSGGLDLDTTGAGWIHVNGIAANDSRNISGTLGLNAQGTGEVSFITAASTFHGVTADATGGTINVGVNLTTTGVEFATPVSVSGASTIASGSGGDIKFDGALSVDNALTLNTNGGVLSFGGAVGSNKTLTLNLAGGSVSSASLSELQNTLTGLTVNSSTPITLPAFTINGPQVYNTGNVTVTGDLGGQGISFNSLVTVAPGSGTALTMNAGTGTLVFGSGGRFDANNVTLIGDEIDFSQAVTGSGSLALQPFTVSRNVAVGGSGTPIVGLNLTAADLARLPIGSLSSLTIGSASGTGSLDVAGILNIPGTPLTLNGGGGITQSGGSITSGALSLYAAGNGISLANGANAFGAVGIAGTPTAVSLTNTLDITQLGSTPWVLGSAPVTLNAGTHDITLNNVGNTFGTVTLTGGNVQVTEAASTDIGASSISKNLTVNSSGGINVSGALATTGNVSFTSAGEVTQGVSAPLTIGGNLSVLTTVNEGDVTVNNSGASATTIGDTFVGGDYTLTATNEAVSQAAGTSLQVAGAATVSGSSINLSGAGNLIGGAIHLPSSSTVVLESAGVIHLDNHNEVGNLTVISQRSSRTFSGSAVGGAAIVLDNAGNNIGGNISVSASPPHVGTAGADVPTGIDQMAGTSLQVAGVASFTAEDSSAGSIGINLTNAGNTFGTLLLSGNIVDVKNSATGLTTIGSAAATTSLTLTTAGALAQTGAIVTPALSVTSAGSVTLNNIGNDAGTLSVSSGGNPISYVDANDVSVFSIDAGGATVSLTAGGTGNLTQTGALQNVTSLTANAGGAVTLTNAGNTIESLAASTAGTGLQLTNTAGDLTVSGAVHTLAGDMTIRNTGDLTLGSNGSLEADAGNVIASAEGTGNFINDSTFGSSALVVGSGKRWLVYSLNPDLVTDPHIVKGGLTSAFRHYGASYASYSPGSVTETGDGFIYGHAASTLTVNAFIDGTASHIYGDNPGGTLSYTISSGLLDSEDNATNVISGGTATYSSALSNTMNAGTYNIKYIGGLTSNYTLVADPVGATYTVTQAQLTYTANTASRAYGAVDPAFSGSISGFKLTDTASSVLTGSAAWATTATSASNVGQYAINGSGYSLVGNNYTFAQAPGNATAFTIGQAGLTVTANGDSKAYNGVAYSGGAGVTYSGFMNGDDSADLSGTLAYGGNAQGARNAGTYSITPTGLSSGNYSITYDSGSLVISRANVTLTSGDVTKTYDGTLAALGTAAATAGTQIFGTDTLSGGTFAFTDANAGNGNKSVTVSGVTVNDGNGGGNYNVSYVNNTTSTINRAALTVGTSNVTKVYDDTLSASGHAGVVSGTLYQNASNSGAQDSLSGGTFAFTDANAGAGNRTVTTSGVTVNDGNGGGNYVLTYVDNTTSTITPAPLTFVGTVADKDYDGTTSATLAGYTLTGFVDSQTVNASSGAAAFLDKNAGVGKAASISGITLSDGTNGGLASNYSVNPTGSATGTINPKVLTVNATVADKVYDGTTNAIVSGYGLSGFVNNETVSGVFTGSASFATKDVGTDKAVTISGVTLVNGANGGLATNYTVSTAANSTADITPATLHVAGVIALDKVYDGTTTANLNTQASVLAGVYGSDDVHIGSITGTYATKDVGTNKAIGTGTVVLSGNDALDYTLVQPSGLTSSVTPRLLTVAGTGVNKVYDGTTAATVNLTDNRIAGDSLSVTSTDAFLDKSAGTGKYISISDIAISGTDAQDYAVNSSAAAYANIGKANLAVSLVGVNKVYDATTAATVTFTDNPLTGDAVDLSFSSASFADKNAGNGKLVTVRGITATGADAENYDISAVATTTANITPATISQVTGITAADKVYDGTTKATLATGALGFVGMYAGDSLSATATGAAFNDKNAGVGKAVTIDGLTLGGADASNYILTSGPMTSTATITPATLTVGAVGHAKVWDGTTSADVTLTDDRIAGDDLSVTDSGASFDSSVVGHGKIVTVSGIQIAGGADRSNYVLGDGSVITTGDITGDATAAYVGSWTHPPVLPQPVIPPTTTPPPSLVDTTLPFDFGTDPGAGSDSLGGAGGSGSAGTFGNGTGSSGAGSGSSGGTDGSHFSAGSLSAGTGTGVGAAASASGGGDGSGSSGTGAAGSGTGNGANGSGASGNNGNSGGTTTDFSNGAAGGNGATGASGDGGASGTSTNSANNNSGGNGGTASGSATGDGASGAGGDLTNGDTGADGSGTGVSNDGTGRSSMMRLSDGSASDATSGDQITVSLVREATADGSGEVAVSVPEDIASSGNFSFPLPAALTRMGNLGAVRATLMNGKRLPSWLRYVSGTKSFVASAMPVGALPIEVLVRIGTQRATVLITQRSSR